MNVLSMMPLLLLGCMMVSRVQSDDVTVYDEMTKVGYHDTWATGSTYDCSWICPSEGEPYEWCGYNGHWWHPSIGHKQCGCDCNANTDMTQCTQLHLEAGNGCTADYNQSTDEVYNGRKVYRSNQVSKVLWYDKTGQTNSNAMGKWVCSGSPGSGNDASCGSNDNHVLAECTSSGFKVTKCKSLFRADGKCGGNYEADNNPGRIAICNMESSKPCCNYKTNTCGGSEGDCWTAGNINYATMKGSCSLEEVNGALTDIDFCDITPLDHVDNQIWQQELWNIAGVITGSIPIVGPVFDLMFGMWDPVSPIDNPWGLTNGLADAVNEQVESLKKCMDQKIFGMYVDMLDTVYGGINNKMIQCYTLSGDQKVSCIDGLMSDMLGTLANWQSPPPGDYPDYLKYQELLPIYQVAMHSWMVISGGNLGDYNVSAQSGEAADLCNFNAALNATIFGTEVFKTWILDMALDAMKTQLTPPNDWNKEDAGCTKDVYKPWNDCYSTLEAWPVNYKGTIYATGKLCNGACSHPNCAGRPADAHSLEINLRMTKSDDYWCRWRYRDPAICESDGSSDFQWPWCDVMHQQASYVVANLKYDVEHFFADEFKKKFSAMLEKWEESLLTISAMPCDKASVADKSKLVDFAVPKMRSASCSTGVCAA